MKCACGKRSSRKIAFLHHLTIPVAVKSPDQTAGTRFVHGVNALKHLEKRPFPVREQMLMLLSVAPKSQRMLSLVIKKKAKTAIVQEACELAEKTIALFGRDLERCGELHEYDDPDTGLGVNSQRFQSLTLLVSNIIAGQMTGGCVKAF